MIALVPLFIALAAVLCGLAILAWTLAMHPQDLTWESWVVIAGVVFYLILSKLTDRASVGSRLHRELHSQQNTRFYSVGVGLALLLFVAWLVSGALPLFFAGLAVALVTMAIDLVLRLSGVGTVDPSRGRPK